ncbi:MAG: hypothetical protein MT490_19880, partial [Sphingomonas sp.]|uniref:hypothetical protein n=1 Tax=Sphingomonas sp. TaxID=28214 RepID=UPI0022767882
MRKLAGAAILLVAAALVAVWGLWLRGGSNGKPVPLTVEQGSSVASVATQLKSQGLIGSATTF